MPPTRPSARPSSSTSSGPPTTGAWTPAATSISTTPAAASTRHRSSRSTWRSCATPSRQPALGQSHVVRRDRARGAGARRRAALLQRARERVRLHLHGQRDGCAAARRRGLSVRPAGRVPGDVRQPQLGQRHPRVRRREGCAHRVRPAPRRPTSAWPTGCSSAISTSAPRAATTSSPIPRSRTSPASSTRSSGSRCPGARLGRHRRLRGVRPHEPARPVGMEAGLRPDLFYKLFGYPTGLGALLARRPALARLQRPWFSGGTVVAANIQGEWSCRCPGHALFEDGPSTTSASRRSRSGCATSSGSASTRSRGGSRCSGRGYSRRCSPSPLGRQPGHPGLRADDLGSPRRHDRLQLPAPRRRRRRRALRRPHRARAQDLGPDRASATPAPARPRSGSRATR